MAAWASTPDAKQARVTKAEYEENGWDYLKEHRWGNVAV
jgi:actin-related protein 5